MRATKLIIENLKAMGATPTVAQDPNGNDIIKVNAPTAPIKNDLPDFNDPWTAFFEPD